MANSEVSSPPKILVLLDLGKSSNEVLKAAFALAKEIKGKIKVLHVKEPAQVVKQSNQFSAKRELYEDFQRTQKKLASLMGEAHGQAAYDLKYGNIKLSVIEALQNEQPEITVLGKRTKKLGNIVGDRLIDTLIEKEVSSLLIVDTERQTQGFSEVPTGVLAATQKLELGLWGSLMPKDPDKIKYFSIEKDVQGYDDVKANNRFVFPNTADPLQNVASYIKKIGAELFLIPKGVDNNFSKKLARKIQTSSVLVVR